MTKSRKTLSHLWFGYSNGAHVDVVLCFSLIMSCHFINNYPGVGTVAHFSWILHHIVPYLGLEHFSILLFHVKHGPAVWPSAGSWLALQSLGLYPDHVSQTLHVRFPSDLCTLRLEMLWCRKHLAGAYKMFIRFNKRKIISCRDEILYLS